MMFNGVSLSSPFLPSEIPSKDNVASSYFISFSFKLYFKKNGNQRNEKKRSWENDTRKELGLKVEDRQIV